MRSRTATFLLAAAAGLVLSPTAGSAAQVSADAVSGLATGTGGLTGSTAFESRYVGGASSPVGVGQPSGQDAPGSVQAARDANLAANITEGSIGQGVEPDGAAGPGSLTEQPAPAAQRVPAAPAATGRTPWAAAAPR